VNHPKAPKSP